MREAAKAATLCTAGREVRLPFRPWHTVVTSLAVTTRAVTVDRV